MKDYDGQEEEVVVEGPAPQPHLIAHNSGEVKGSGRTSNELRREIAFPGQVTEVTGKDSQPPSVPANNFLFAKTWKVNIVPRPAAGIDETPNPQTEVLLFSDFQPGHFIGESIRPGIQLLNRSASDEGAVGTTRQSRRSVCACLTHALPLPALSKLIAKLNASINDRKDQVEVPERFTGPATVDRMTVRSESLSYCSSATCKACAKWNSALYWNTNEDDDHANGNI